MKKFSLLALAAAGLLFGACSEKDAVVNETNATNSYDLIPGKNSWLAVGIALPDGGSTTRANEDLVDGEEDEFAVYSAKLLIFKGGTEATATYFGEYDLKPASTDFTPEDKDQVPGGNKEGTTANGYGEITSSSKRYVTQITNPNLGAEDKLWAYAILNYDGNSTGIDASGKTFAEFSRDKFTAIGIADESKGFGDIKEEKGLVMTSVPISDGAGGPSISTETTPKISTLSQIQSNAIFETKEDAQKATNPLTCIYVERAAVKVELRNSVSTLKGSSVSFTVQSWALGNINNNGAQSGYYNTRQFNSDWIGYFNVQAPTNTKYRMLGRTGFWTTDVSSKHNPTGYRTYFGEDVNFDGNEGLINYQLTSEKYIPFNTTDGAKNITYTYENTIDENSMIYKNTTYVGIKAKIGTGDFWVEEGQPNTKLDNASDIATRVKANASSTFDTAIGNIDAAISTDLSSETSTIFSAVGNAGETVVADEIKVNYSLDATVSLTSVDETTAEQSYTYQITMTIDNIIAKKNGTAVTLSNDQKNAVESAVRNLPAVSAVTTPTNRTNATKFYLYDGGISYYSMRIAHFGGTDINSGDKNFANGETPWSAPSSAYNNYLKVYPMDGQSVHGVGDTPSSPINYGESRAAAWLGRWSIVRNNWYVLDIKSVEGLGSPVPENYRGEGFGDTPDDNPGRSYYIAAEIHILPWAKRYQSVNF